MVDESAVAPAQWLAPLDAAGLAAGVFTVEVTAGDHDLWVEGPDTGTSDWVRLTGR